MPLYEYECEACAQRFERIQKFSDPPAETCPACNGRVKKLLSSPAIQFKGSGWYITDYAKKGTGESPKPAGGGEDKKPSESAEGGKPATDTAPAKDTKPSAT